MTLLQVQVDEVSKLTEAQGSSLKNMITAPTISYEKKGRDTIVVDNISNLLFTSNDESTLPISSDDRRFVLFKCSSVYKGDMAYFDELTAHLERPDVQRAFYQHLLKVDLSAYKNNMQGSRPVTKYYRDMQRVSASSFSGFFSAMVNDDRFPLNIGAVEFYGRYKDFHNNNGYKTNDILSNTAFGNAVRDLPSGAAVKRKMATCNAYVSFDAAIIRSHLESKNEFDPYSSLT
jgi:hypothetical protein